VPDFRNFFSKFNSKKADIKRTVTGVVKPGTRTPGGVGGTSAYSRSGRDSYTGKSDAEPNPLHQFASYNTLFTLSALTSAEISDSKSFFRSKPHHIIAQSSGIESKNNYRQGPPGPSGNKFSADDKKIIEKNSAIREAANKSSLEFQQNRDIYFKNVEILSVPGYNEKRRLTSATKIDIELVEPYGLTFLDKVRAAAFKNGFLDHLTAPFLLTIEFRGFDENGKPLLKETEALKRVIPVKLMTCEIDVNQGGSYYRISAIPYDEFGLQNLYIYPRTSGELRGEKLTISDAVSKLETLLNEQNKEETKGEFNSKPDQYQITVDETLLENGEEIDYKILNQAGMGKTATEGPGGNFTYKYIPISTGVSVLKVLEEIMKSNKNFGKKTFDEWANKIQKMGSAGSNDYNAATDLYFKYFRIRSNIVPGEFDPIRQTSQKKVIIVVEPYYINAYNLASAGIHNGASLQTYIAKRYNYIFTGENVDILDLGINYKVAYYQTRLKDLDAKDTKDFKKSNTPETKDTDTPSGQTVPAQGIPDVLLTQTEVGLAKTESGNNATKVDPQTEQFFDAITNPTADMVIIRMEILGDPAWLGQSQFMPPSPRPRGPGISTDNNIAYFRGGQKTNVWNPELKCYNSEAAEPVIDLQFVVPDDIDDVKGTYDISSSQRAIFSGLYKVYQVRHSMVDGKFTQELTMVRYNNQDRPASSGVSNKTITTTNGIIQNGTSGPPASARFGKNYGNRSSANNVPPSQRSRRSSNQPRKIQQPEGGSF